MMKLEIVWSRTRQLNLMLQAGLEIYIICNIYCAGLSFFKPGYQSPRENFDRLYQAVVQELGFEGRQP